MIESKIRCEFCDFEFLDSASLLLHSASHNPADGYECTNCDITSMTTIKLSSHWTSNCPFELYEKDKHVNVRALYVCNVCENKFDSLDELYEHRFVLFYNKRMFNGEDKKR